MAKIAFSDVKLRSLSPPDRGQIAFWDEKLPSFGIRVSQGGSKTFVLNRNNTLLTIGKFGVLTLAKARTEAKRMLAEFTLGRVRPQSITFQQAVQVFLEEKGARRRARTVADHKRHLNLLSFKSQLAEITHDDLSRKLKKLPPSEFNHRLACAKTFFNWAQKKRYITDNPVIGLSPHSRPPRTRVLTDAELKSIWLACSLEPATPEDGSPPPSDGDLSNLPRAFAAIVKLLILLGQRETETAALHSSWVKEDTITLPGTITKNHNEHTLPIGTMANLVLAAHAADGLLFPARDKPNRSFNGWSKGKAALDELSGVTGWTLHDIRRTFRSNSGKLGVAPHIAERLVNHISARTDMEKTYDLYRYLPEMRDAMEKWEAYLAKIIA